MDIQFYGANCVALTAGGTRAVVDDNLADLGAKSVLKAGDVALFTGAHGNGHEDAKLIIDGPGEYEISDISIQGIPARSHLEEAGKKSVTMYKITAKDISVLVLGHVYPELSENQLEQIGLVDVLITPVGGSGYTLDPIGALELIKKIEPKLIIPTHYSDSILNFPVPQIKLDEALATLGMQPAQATSKLKLKPSELTDTMQLVVIEK
jgi:L-ascorbate metabolism protein UlaG (beta-lactamase superfamily)